ncbi:hypothetical protein SVIOM342S_07609 [Streptomyces violaceorubidus]
MIAVMMVKPVIVIVLGLAAWENATQSVAAIVSGLAIILLAIFLGDDLRFVPGFGDEIANGRNNRIMQGAEGKAAAVISSPANLVAQGMGPTAPATTATAAADSPRPPRPAPRTPPPAESPRTARAPRTAAAEMFPPAAPAPRSGSPVNTPHASNTRNTRNSQSTGGDGR